MFRSVKQCGGRREVLKDRRVLVSEESSRRLERTKARDGLGGFDHGIEPSRHFGLSRIVSRAIGVALLSLASIAVSRGPLLIAQEPEDTQESPASSESTTPVAPAPSAPAPATPPSPACSAPEYRQFDFWLGEWDVHSASGNTASNSITRLYGDCGLLETYVAGAFRGSSLNYYDQTSGRWFQTWVDNGGSSLRLSGGLDGRSMVLSTGEGSIPFDRITWTPNADGSVRQHWQRSTDGGKTWTNVFDGTYVRKSTKSEE